MLIFALIPMNAYGGLAVGICFLGNGDQNFGFCDGILPTKAGSERESVFQIFNQQKK